MGGMNEPKTDCPAEYGYVMRVTGKQAEQASKAAGTHARLLQEADRPIFDRMGGMNQPAACIGFLEDDPFSQSKELLEETQVVQIRIGVTNLWIEATWDRDQALSERQLTGVMDACRVLAKAFDIPI